MGLKLIALEGIDACGKNTQVRAVSQALWSMGYKVLVQDFPRYPTLVGGLINQALKGNVQMSPEAFHVLCEVDRYDFMRELPRLEAEGYDFIILDRWTLSNLAFAGAKGINVDWVKSLQSGLQKADVTFILEITVGESVRRRPERRDLHESNLELLDNVRHMYKRIGYIISEKDDELIINVDGMQTPELITEEILAHIKLSLLSPPELADSDVGKDSVPILIS